MTLKPRTYTRDEAEGIAGVLSAERQLELVVVVRVDVHGLVYLVPMPPTSEYDAVTADDARVFYPGAPIVSTWQRGQQTAVREL